MALARFAVMLVVFACGLGGMPARAADSGPVFVVSGKAGVPVIINGRDARGAIVLGDWGLDRPSDIAPIVIPLRSFRLVPRRRYHHHCCRPCRTVCRPRPQVRRAVPRAVPRFIHYFPGGELMRPSAKAPAPQDLSPPKPAESYHREWSTESMPLPATLAPPANVEINPNINLNGSPSAAGAGQHRRRGRNN
jgi:hypothetical protein